MPRFRFASALPSRGDLILNLFKLQRLEPSTLLRKAKHHHRHHTDRGKCQQFSEQWKTEAEPSVVWYSGHPQNSHQYGIGWNYHIGKAITKKKRLNGNLSGYSVYITRLCH